MPSETKEIKKKEFKPVLDGRGFRTKNVKIESIEKIGMQDHSKENLQQLAAFSAAGLSPAKVAEIREKFLEDRNKNFMKQIKAVKSDRSNVMLTNSAGRAAEPPIPEGPRAAGTGRAVQPAAAIGPKTPRPMDHENVLNGYAAKTYQRVKPASPNCPDKYKQVTGTKGRVLHIEEHIGGHNMYDEANQKDALRKYLRAYQSGQVNLANFKQVLAENNVPTNQQIEKMFTKHENGDTVSYQQLGKELFKKFDSEENKAKSGFLLQQEVFKSPRKSEIVKQPRDMNHLDLETTVDEDFISKQKRFIGHCYVPRKGRQEGQSQFTSTVSEVVFKNNDDTKKEAHAEYLASFKKKDLKQFYQKSNIITHEGHDNNAALAAVANRAQKYKGNKTSTDFQLA